MRIWIWLSVIVVALLQSPAAPKKGGNPDAAKIKNAIETSPASIAAGRRVYTRMCGRCHGPEGKGDGTAATAPVPDLTDAAWDYGGSDGEIFVVIHDGVSADMDGYAARLSDADIWNVVNFVRSVAAKP